MQHRHSQSCRHSLTLSDQFVGRISASVLTILRVPATDSCTQQPLPEWLVIHTALSKITDSEDLLFLKFRECLDPTRFRSGKGDLIASMQGV